MNKNIYYLLLIPFLLFSCKTDQKPDITEKIESKPKKTIKVPRFDANNAYKNIEAQVALGPRVPNSEAHENCKDWIVSSLETLDIEVVVQEFKAASYDGDPYLGKNIIGRYNPDNPERIILAAHWDTRFTADEDEDKSASVQADDGGSGVGVLVELARLLKENPIDLGVDLIFFDLEDQGKSGRASDQNTVNTWGLGAQYWAKNPHVDNYKAKYGILMDMVGAKGATFPKENVNGVFSPNLNRKIHQLYKKVWTKAKGMGRGDFFVDRTVRGGIDDHYFVNALAAIPMIDIINKKESDSSFGPHWHTHDDNMDIIDPKTLGAVGQVVIAVVFAEEMGRF